MVSALRMGNQLQTAESSIEESIETLEKLKRISPQLRRVEDIIRLARDQGNTVFIFGNGGSGSTAVHFAADLMKTATRPDVKRIKAISLNDNLSLTTAWANDASYEHVFKEQLENLMKPGDVVIAISGSGNSKNVLLATEYARSNGGITIGLTGFDGGSLKSLASVPVVVPSNDMLRIEDTHLAICHLVVRLLRDGRTDHV